MLMWFAFELMFTYVKLRAKISLKFIEKHYVLKSTMPKRKAFVICSFFLGIFLCLDCFPQPFTVSTTVVTTA
jgi:hypothetical protein